MTQPILRSQLSPEERERFDLGYLDPTADSFAINVITEPFIEEAHPVVTIYSLPKPHAALDLTWIHGRLADPSLRAVDPIPENHLVHDYNRPIADGVVAYDGGDWRTADELLVLRRSGSVELVAPDIVSGSDKDGRFYIYQTILVMRFAQVLNYIARLGSEIDRSDWHAFVNIRDARSCKLGVPHRSYRSILHDDDGGSCLDRHLQFDFAISGRSPDEITRLPLEFDRRLNFAFGFDRPRAHSTEGTLR